MTKALCLYHSVLKVPLKDCIFPLDLKKTPNQTDCHVHVSNASQLSATAKEKLAQNMELG